MCMFGAPVLQSELKPGDKDNETVTNKKMKVPLGTKKTNTKKKNTAAGPSSSKKGGGNQTGANVK